MFEMKILNTIEKIRVAKRNCDRNYDRDEIAELNSFLREVNKIYSEFIAHGKREESKLDAIIEAI